MQICANAIQLTPDEIANRTDRSPLLTAIASVAAQETVTPPKDNWTSSDVHGVTFDVVLTGYNSWIRTRNILGIQLKVGRDHRTVLQRRVMLSKAGTLDIAKLRAAYAECRAKAGEVTIMR